MSLPPAGPQAYRGERIGLPESGRGSLVWLGPRVGAFLIDVLASALVAGLFVQIGHSDQVTGRLPGSWSLVPLAVDYVIGLLVSGRTVGMALLDIRVVRVDRDAAVDPWRVLVRTALLFLLLPALILDRDGRGFHDRLSGTAVVRS